MLYSNTCRSCPRINHLLLGALCLTSQLCLAEPDLLGGDLGLASSAANNTLIDADTLDKAPALPSITPAEAAEVVRSKIGGQVMSVNTQQNATGVVYGVKVLNAGRMRVIHVDGQSGQLLNQ